MGNQHPSITEEDIYTIAINAKLGDGYLWRHPECYNYKARFSSITKELLELKQNLCPIIFKTGVVQHKISEKGRFANAKVTYHLNSLTHPIFTEIAEESIPQVLNRLTIFDLALWYLDDGCCIIRTDRKKLDYRFVLCIGNIAPTQEDEDNFLSMLFYLFPTEKTLGRIYINGSKGTIYNKCWGIPKRIAKQLIAQVKHFNVLSKKCPDIM